MILLAGKCNFPVSQGATSNVSYFQTADASPWTENHREPSAEERDKAQIDTVLTDFTEWVNQHSTELPEFDSAMLFTGCVVLPLGFHFASTCPVLGRFTHSLTVV